MRKPKDTKTDLFFEVAGAGYLQLSRDATWETGGETGFSIGCSWGGSGGSAGGVLPREEARALAKAILKELSDPDEW